MLMPNLTLDASFRRARSASTPSVFQDSSTHQLMVEAKKFAEEKEKAIFGEDKHEWKEAIRQEMEQSLNERVREALHTPPLERLNKNRDKSKQKTMKDFTLNSHIGLDLTDKERAFMQHQRWKLYQRKRRKRNKEKELMKMDSSYDFKFQDSLSKSNQGDFPAVFGLDSSHSLLPPRPRPPPQTIAVPRIISSTKSAFHEAMLTGQMPDGSLLKKLSNGKFMDKYGVVRDEHGPFWPTDYSPLYGAPHFVRLVTQKVEPLYSAIIPETDPGFHKKKVPGGIFYDNQVTQYKGKWRGVAIVYDASKSSRDYTPPPVSEECCPSLRFESRFESGNLQQARRVGQYEYELVLQTDLYTKRHTQWYYFRVQNTQPGIIYKFRIVNLLKKDSLYNHGMQPLVYSEKDATRRGIGWVRKGHHISYARNTQHLTCPLLLREMTYYELEFQVEFQYADDTCYFAHCYPYTFTDLRDDLDAILANSDRRKYIVREVMCETKVGNSCFLLTITNFENPDVEKKVIIVTGRVHPGESNASWMMKGFVDFLVSDNEVAKELRDNFIFKVVPMLNPDGVIVGNYRCSLQCRDLNRNYRHPKKESFPSVWCTKDFMEKLAENHEIIFYCDMHGHSRKQNVFMYGCSSPDSLSGKDVKEFLADRIIPYLMSLRAPEKFSFNSCRFHIKRCKESTGRVVMWRQFNIAQSFTLEATFSGTTICNEAARHFTTMDLEEMGRSLAEVIHEYSITRQNKEKESEVILDLTKEITQQILSDRASKGVVENGNEEKKPDTTGDAKEDSTSLDSGRISDDQVYPTVPQTKTIKSHVSQDLVLSEMDSDQSRQNSAGSSGKSDVDSLEKLLDNVNNETIEGCMELLSQLNIGQAFSEGSDSSDSDSESEPEMPIVEDVKRKKKKKKTKKEGSRVRSTQDKKSNEPKPLFSNSSARSLPALKSTDISNNHARKQVTQGHKTPIFKDHRVFINRYQGRSNGGIPCFSEERSLERAARRITEMKKKMQDQGHDFFTFSDDDVIPPMFNNLPRDLSQEVRQKFQAAIEEGTSNISESLASHCRFQDPVAFPGTTQDDTNTGSESDEPNLSTNSLAHSAPATVYGQRVSMFGKYMPGPSAPRRRSLTPMAQSSRQRRLLTDSSWANDTGNKDSAIQGANILSELIASSPHHAKHMLPRAGKPVLPSTYVKRHTSDVLLPLHGPSRGIMSLNRHSVSRQSWSSERHYTCE